MNGFTREAPVALRVLLEDALKHAFDCDEAGRGATLESLAGAIGKSREEAATALGELRARGLVGLWFCDAEFVDACSHGAARRGLDLQP